MPSLNLTDIAIQHLKPSDNQTLYFDTMLAGFGLRVSSKAKSFIVVYGSEHNRKRETIGRYPDISLKDARNRARAIIAEKTGPSVPMAQKPYSEACAAFEEAMAGKVKPPTLQQYLSYLNMMEFDKPIGQITYADILEQLKKWDGRKFSQNYAYASIRNFFNWCLEVDYITKSPLFRKLPPNKTRSRDRVLSDEELGKVWRNTTDDTYGRMMRLMLLTGQRRIEVRNLKPEDVSDGLITFHTKGDQVNVLPVTPLVKENLVLPFQFNNWSGAKARFDNECGVDFRHHDLRRTLATKMAQLGISVITIERILGHSLGRVTKIYNRYSYLPEVEKALLTYEDHIRKLAVL